MAYQALEVLRACKGFQDYEENQAKQVCRVHQDIKAKEDFREFQEKTERRVKMAGLDHRAHLALWVKEDFLVCPDSQVSKAIGVSQASMALKGNRVFKVKKGQQERQEDKGHREQLAQLGHEESEAEMDLQDHREYEESTVSQGHQDHRVPWGTPAHQDYPGHQE